MSARPHITGPAADPGGGPPLPEGLLRRAIRWAAAAGVLTLLTIAALAALSGPSDTWEAARSIQPRGVLLALTCQGLALMILGQVYRTSLRAVGGRSSYRGAAAAALSAYALTQLLPAGGALGGALAARRFHQVGNGPVTAVAAVAHTGFVSLAALALVVAASTVAVAASSDDYLGHALVAASVPLVLLTCYGAGRRLTEKDATRRWVGRRLRRLERRGHALPTRSIAELRARTELLVPLRRLARPLAWSTLKWMVDLLVVSLLLVAAGGRWSLIAVAVSYGLANVLNNLPLTPGGIGLIEGGMTGSLIAFGTDPAVATVTTLSYRTFAYWVPTLACIPVLSTTLLRARPGGAPA